MPLCNIQTAIAQLAGFSSEPQRRRADRYRQPDAPHSSTKAWNAIHFLSTNCNIIVGMQQDAAAQQQGENFASLPFGLASVRPEHRRWPLSAFSVCSSQKSETGPPVRASWSPPLRLGLRTRAAHLGAARSMAHRLRAYAGLMRQTAAASKAYVPMRGGGGGPVPLCKPPTQPVSA